MRNRNELPFDQHDMSLQRAYCEVGDRTWLADDLLESNLESSRGLFTLKSLASRRPYPKELEVYALLSGLSFSDDFTEKLVKVQRNISAVIGESLHYWVAPANFGLEYCVFKWPNESWNEEWIHIIQDAIASVSYSSYQFNIRGVQINPDGCVVAKGFDEDGILFKIRKYLRDEIPFLPLKQSVWAHVPLGRILEPLGVEKFVALTHLMAAMSNSLIAKTEITSMKLVHETRWYMEEKSVLSEFFLADNVNNEFL